ncbi:MAG: acyl carrier protein [Nitrospirae bacterium]|nr:acyl carrier protein [Nitrospirota bacterium]
MFTEKEINNRIKKVIMHSLELNLHEDDFLNIKNLDELFGMDSVAIIELVIGLEQEFKIEIHPEYLNSEIFKNMDTLTAYISTLMNRKMGE